MIREDEIRPTFGGHEKFVFRNGWLKKGIDAVRVDRLIFTRDEALVTLGVGKNMVRSIRHWCLATGIVQETEGTGLAKPLAASMLGERLLLENGWDPYLEDMGSLWLIHWQLISNPVRAFVWPVIFSAYFDAEFSKKQLIVLISKQIEQLSIRTTEGTIEREIDCVLRTYVPAGGVRGQANEESMDCPLAELDLIQAIPEENLYRFNIGSKPSLPTAVFGYALFIFLLKRLQTRRTIAIEEVLYQNGSPGQAFKLDENSFVDYLEQLEYQTSGALRINETAGLRQIYLTDDLAVSMENRAYRLLDDYYGRD
ncbi:DUF4007 family protein [Levilinea saccharolytica]|uniref:DUF4007 family protein n=1 Tax=Levilinea saccharolytica TaxID=229921 RepID=UPI0007854F8F|nr:DUF4007 family protein [Levilinea saccharolytica]GAP17324.1 hypothetical protein LSAC_01193 [Levilinea saccharolytica]